MNHFKKELTARELSALPDEQIDYSDIPELDDTFWEKARPFDPGTQQFVMLNMDKEILDFFQKKGPGYLDHMHAVLKAYVLAQLPPPGSSD